MLEYVAAIKYCTLTRCCVSNIAARGTGGDRAVGGVVIVVVVKGGKDSEVGGRKEGEFEACKYKPLVFLATPSGD